MNTTMSTETTEKTTNSKTDFRTKFTLLEDALAKHVDVPGGQWTSGNELQSMTSLAFLGTEEDMENTELLYAAKRLRVPVRADAGTIGGIVDLDDLFGYLKTNGFTIEYLESRTNVDSARTRGYDRIAPETVTILAYKHDAVFNLEQREAYLSYSLYSNFERSRAGETFQTNNAKSFVKFAESVAYPVESLKKSKAESYVISFAAGSYRLTGLNFGNRSSASKKLESSSFEDSKVINYPSIAHSKLEKFASSDGCDLFGKLLLLCGKPGTGKTTYIRNMIDSYVTPNTKVVFVNSSNVAQFGSPEFINFALTYLQNCLLVIEEAEKIIVSREENTNSPISELLNITDGVLGDALNIRVVCTFNTNSVNVDSALKRDGRLFHLQEFELHTEQQALDWLKKHIPNPPAKLVSYCKNLDDYYRGLMSFQERKPGSMSRNENGKFVMSLADLYSILNTYKETFPEQQQEANNNNKPVINE